MALKIVVYTSMLEDGAVLLCNSEEDEIYTDHPADLLEFLGEDFSDKGYRELKAVWNLDVFISVVLRRLGMKVCRELIKPAHEALFTYENGSTVLYDIKNKPSVLPEGVYDVFYIPSKIFGLQVGGHKSYFYHLVQYYEDEEEPKDIYDVYGKTRDLIEAFKQMNLNPYKLTSPIAVYQSSVLEHMDVPTILDIPRDLPENDIDDIIECSEELMTRNWLEAYAVGKWDTGESWDYDIQSAYAYHLANLKNFRYAKFAKAKNYCPDADEGLLKGVLTIYPDVKVHPIVMSNGNGNSTPTGTKPDVRTLSEIRFIEHWRIGEFKLDYGYFWKYKAPVKPFEIPLQRVFEVRNKGGLVRKLAKRIGAAVWAKLIQQNTDGSINTHYNPIMAMQTVTNSRLQVGEFIYQRNLQKHLLHVSIDGLRASRKVDLRYEKSQMGAWKMGDPSACIILSSGRVFTSDKKPQGLYYQDVVDMIKEHPRDNYYHKTIKRPQTLAESVEIGSLSGLGVVREFHTSIDVNLARTSQDRIFREFPYNGGELLNNKYYSEPIKL